MKKHCSSAITEFIIVNNNKSNSKCLPPAVKEKKSGILKFETNIVWFNVIGFMLLHTLAVCGILQGAERVFKGKKLLSFVYTCLWELFFGVCGGFGVTMGAHRLWSHKAYKAKQPLEIILMLFHTIAGQDHMLIWARDHRQHHKFSDTDADPHNSHRGFFFSHMGWLMLKKHPEVIANGKRIDMSDLEANTVIQFQKKYYAPLYFAFGFLAPWVVPIYCWNEDVTFALTSLVVRYTISLHLTWCVNSVAHFYGYRPYDMNIRPVESKFTAIFALGEGWHNYHHTFPWDYKTSELGSPFNPSRIMIEYAAKMGWAYDLREASDNVIASKVKKHGDVAYTPLLTQNIEKLSAFDKISKSNS